MMKVKGTAVSSLSDFVMSGFGEQGYGEWLASLPSDSRAVLSEPAVPTKWYPLGSAMSRPLEVLCDLFFDGDIRGARESGRHRAKVAMASSRRNASLTPPESLIRRAEKVLSSCYVPSVVDASMVSPGNGVLRFSYLSEINRFIEARLVGYVEKGLELYGARNVRVLVTSSLAQGRPYGEFRLSWN